MRLAEDRMGAESEAYHAHPAPIAGAVTLLSLAYASFNICSGIANANA
jgi:hypothetical protein